LPSRHDDSSWRYGLGRDSLEKKCPLEGVSEDLTPTNQSPSFQVHPNGWVDPVDIDAFRMPQRQDSQTRDLGNVDLIPRPLGVEDVLRLEQEEHGFVAEFLGQPGLEVDTGRDSKVIQEDVEAGMGERIEELNGQLGGVLLPVADEDARVLRSQTREGEDGRKNFRDGGSPELHVQVLQRVRDEPFDAALGACWEDEQDPELGTPLGPVHKLRKGG
jgi:hypothetical protein